MEKFNLTWKQECMINDAYVANKNLIKQIARKYANRRYEVTDIESYLNERFTKVMLAYDQSKGKLGAYLNRVLAQRAENYIKSKEARYMRDTVAFSALDDQKDAEADDTPTFEETKVTDGLWLDREVEKQTEVTTAIATLLKNATDKQRKIIEVYLNTDVKPSLTQVGKQVGLGHEQVKRELAKLAKLVNFDISILAK